ncbi:hypothetical protein AB7179_21715 [Providencia manganoxydans]|uniref:DUF2971 domain-containing protein n=3 Tax=Providencia manganoxydans TaxID=2923283 RepID=A0ABX7AFE5_9GAMM|nr:hypothetical protein JI723_01275 [Providencia manganoxydans]
MKTINSIEKYVIKNFAMKNLDLTELNHEIFSDFKNDFNEAKNNSSPMDFISFFSLLDRDRSSIAMGYLNELYNKKEKNFFFEKFFYHSNLLFLMNYYDDEDNGFVWSLSEQGEILLMDFACDDFRIGHLCYDKIIESIQSGKMADSLPMYTRPQKLGVLAIEMLASEKNQTIDWESAGIPIDPFYQRFCQEALYNENHDVVAQWLITLCDKHVEWSALFGINSDEQRSTGYEIDMEILLAWPFEYQAVKNFRAKQGLSTPIIDHPLLKTPMAIEHRPDMVGWKQNRPAIYDQMIDDLITINPELQVINKLF